MRTTELPVFQVHLLMFTPDATPPETPASSPLLDAIEELICTTSRLSNFTLVEVPVALESCAVFEYEMGVVPEELGVLQTSGTLLSHWPPPVVDP